MTILDELENFYDSFNGRKKIIGKSELGRNIYAFKVVKTDYPVVIAQYAIHAREYITTYLALEQINAYNLIGVRGTVYFIPAVNPDGISKVLGGDRLYKANANGVDLNVNFPAKWGTGASNVKNKGSANFIGEYPLSEKESVALYDFTLKVKPDATVSYHSKGEEIYWYFNQDEVDAKRDLILASEVSRATGYPLKLTPNSAGGYKDWCIDSLKIPALTIEVGDDNLTHPIGREHLDLIFRKNKDVISVITESEIWK